MGEMGEDEEDGTKKGAMGRPTRRVGPEDKLGTLGMLDSLNTEIGRAHV